MSLIGRKITFSEEGSESPYYVIGEQECEDHICVGRESRYCHMLMVRIINIETFQPLGYYCSYKKRFK